VGLNSWIKILTRPERIEGDVEVLKKVKSLMQDVYYDVKRI